jgi:hypothetical protein
MTSDCHRLYLDTHVSNSVRRTGTVRLDSRAILDRLAISYDRDGPGGTVKQWCPSVAPMMDKEIMTRTATLAYGDGGGHNHGMRVPPLSYVGPACGGKGDAASGLPTPLLLSVICLFFFFFSPSRSCTPVLSLKL